MANMTNEKLEQIAKKARSSQNGKADQRKGKNKKKKRKN